MINAFYGIGYFSAVIYGLLIDGTYWKIYLTLFMVYLVFVSMSRVMKDNPKRKTLIAATWQEPSDPTSYIIQDVNCTNALEYIKKLNEQQKEVKITMTHVTAYGMALGLYQNRRDIGRLVWGFFKHSKKLGITVLVDVEGGRDLIPVTVWDAHQGTILEFAAKINDKIKRAQQNKDKAHTQSTMLANYIPSFIVQPLMMISTYISIAIGINITPLGLRNDQFGHFVLTNVGSLGYQQGFPPLCPPMRAMAFFCTGAIIKKPVVIDDQIVIAPIMNVTQTADHRFGDAAQWLPFTRAFTGYMKDPENFKASDYKEVPHWSELKNK